MTNAALLIPFCRHLRILPHGWRFIVVAKLAQARAMTSLAIGALGCGASWHHMAVYRQLRCPALVGWVFVAPTQGWRHVGWRHVAISDALGGATASRPGRRSWLNPMP